MQTVQQVLAQAQFYSDEGQYRVVKLPARGITAAAGVLAEVGEAFMALIVDKDEVTLVLDDEACTEYARRLYDAVYSDKVYRLITLDVVLDFDLVGLMAHLSAALAAAGISILPLAAYSRDHLLVPLERFDDALAVLRRLQAQSS
ncbi:MAG: ACT domain-containing protein [Anaerolineae bacterium]|jgi:hypothetical protein|nr:ACT domain-containing protein [Anaerolineae bacterium]